ncbi:putative membrane protein [Collimonas arenae]|uniref:Putative membrane protein n=1 Tax=Collimonas arenae TaxID=279058 RepID=A0A127QLG3_9BURK|nr:putative membrane protein [Collimonas arenae]AMP10442.1 putative membrane protein [Collimonas arenae]
MFGARAALIPVLLITHAAIRPVAAVGALLLVAALIVALITALIVALIVALAVVLAVCQS